MIKVLKITLKQADYLVEELKGTSILGPDVCLVATPRTKTRMDIRLAKIRDVRKGEIIIFDPRYMNMFHSRVNQGLNKLQSQQFLYNRINQFLRSKQT